jgi:hypothetical protein
VLLWGVVLVLVLWWEVVVEVDEYEVLAVVGVVDVWDVVVEAEEWEVVAVVCDAVDDIELSEVAVVVGDVVEV